MRSVCPFAHILSNIHTHTHSTEKGIEEDQVTVDDILYITNAYPMLHKVLLDVREFEPSIEALRLLEFVLSESFFFVSCST